MQFADEYLQIYKDYNLSGLQRLQSLHNVLHGDAKIYYLDKIDGFATSFQQATKMLEEEYNYAVRKTRVKKYLKLLRVTTFLANGMEMPAAIAKIYKIIIKLSRQAPR